MTPEIINGICQHIDADTATTVLWVSTTSDDLPLNLPCTHCIPDEAEIEKHENVHFDYAVLTDLPGALTHASAEALIARMRDINAQKVFWVLGEAAPWTPKDAISLGFHQLQQDKGFTLYGFDINNYKSTPDWLNAKHWANPERWNQNRW